MLKKSDWFRCVIFTPPLAGLAYVTPKIITWSEKFDWPTWSCILEILITIAILGGTVVYVKRFYGDPDAKKNKLMDDIRKNRKL